VDGLGPGRQGGPGEDDLVRRLAGTARSIGISFDGKIEGRQAILEGKFYAEPIQFPKKMGRITMENILKYLNGETFEKVILIPTEIYKKEDALKDPELNET